MKIIFVMVAILVATVISVRAETRITVVSTSPDGAHANSSVENPVLSGDGEHLAFFSYADNLGPSVPQVGLKLYWKDLKKGEVKVITYSNGEPLTFGALESDLYLSHDGRYIAFEHSHDLHELSVFRRDMQTGEEVEVPGTNWCVFLGMSPDGNVFVYYDHGQVFAYQFSTGKTLVVSATPEGTPANDNYSHCTYVDNVEKFKISMSYDGKKIAFASCASNLKSSLASEPVVYRIYLKNIETGDIQVVAGEKMERDRDGNLFHFDSPVISYNAETLIYRKHSWSYAWAITAIKNLETGRLTELEAFKEIDTGGYRRPYAARIQLDSNGKVLFGDFECKFDSNPRFTPSIWYGCLVKYDIGRGDFTLMHVRPGSPHDGYGDFSVDASGTQLVFGEGSLSRQTLLLQQIPELSANLPKKEKRVGNQP